MTFRQGTEEYYQKFIELQEKLRKSEEERLVLEMKFNEMMQVTREEEQSYYKKLRSQYKQFLEENRKRQERNERILRLLERVESRAAMLEAKTQRIQFLRRQYHNYLDRISVKNRAVPENNNNVRSANNQEVDDHTKASKYYKRTALGRRGGGDEFMIGCDENGRAPSLGYNERRGGEDFGHARSRGDDEFKLGYNQNYAQDGGAQFGRGDDPMRAQNNYGYPTTDHNLRNNFGLDQTDHPAMYNTEATLHHRNGNNDLPYLRKYDKDLQNSFSKDGDEEYQPKSASRIAEDIMNSIHGRRSSVYPSPASFRHYNPKQEEERDGNNSALQRNRYAETNLTHPLGHASENRNDAHTYNASYSLGNAGQNRIDTHTHPLGDAGQSGNNTHVYNQANPLGDAGQNKNDSHIYNPENPLGDARQNRNDTHIYNTHHPLDDGSQKRNDTHNYNKIRVAEENINDTHTTQLLADAGQNGKDTYNTSHPLGGAGQNRNGTYNITHPLEDASENKNSTYNLNDLGPKKYDPSSLGNPRPEETVDYTNNSIHAMGDSYLKRSAESRTSVSFIDEPNGIGLNKDYDRRNGSIKEDKTSAKGTFSNQGGEMMKIESAEVQQPKDQIQPNLQDESIISKKTPINNGVHAGLSLKDIQDANTVPISTNKANNQYGNKQNLKGSIGEAKDTPDTDSQLEADQQSPQNEKLLDDPQAKSSTHEEIKHSVVDGSSDQKPRDDRSENHEATLQHAMNNPQKSTEDDEGNTYPQEANACEQSSSNNQNKINSEGNVDVQNNPTGQQSRINYESNMKDPTGQPIPYDNNAQILELEGTGQPISYENEQPIQSGGDSQDYKDQIQYDENGQPINYEHEATGQTIQYDSSDRPNEDGQKLECNEDGQPIQHEGSNEVNDYDQNGQPIQYDPTGEPLQYDPNNQPIQYDGDGQPIQYDPNNQELQYDENGQPIGYDQAIEYDANGQPLQYDQNSQQYDSNGQPIAYDTNAQYDPNNLPMEYDVNGQAIEYDANNQPIQYDANGQPIQYDEHGQPIQYDEHGQLIQYDDNGQPIQYDDNGHPIQYDENGQPIQYDENGQPIQYDENGQPIQYDENGQPIQYGEYDENNQAVVYDSHEATNQQHYDENGQLVTSYSGTPQEAIDPSSQISFIETEGGKKQNVLDLLETDTESGKQDTNKVSNDSDFDFSNAT